MKYTQKASLKTLACLFCVSFFMSESVLQAQLIAPSGISPAFAANLVGVVAAARGEVHIGKSGEVGRIAESGEPVYLGDEVSTDAAGHLQILLLDETVFTIGPNSTIAIDTFVYDPATHDGKIDARVVRGVFRFITGQIAHKKPSNVEVKLPSGTVGVRGTIFYGKVEGNNSLILLLGPGEKNNTGHRQGKIIVSNSVNGNFASTEVKKSGFGTRIEGENIPPTTAFEVPREQIQEMISAVNPAADLQKEVAKDEPQKTPGARPADQPQKPAQTRSEMKRGSESSQTKTPMPSAPPIPHQREVQNSPDSATKQAGQDTASGYTFLRDLSGVTEVNKLLFDKSTESSRDSGNSTAETTFNMLNNTIQSSFDDLRARTVVGTSHFSGSGGLSQGGSYDVQMDINFGSKSIGGGGSRITVDGSQFNGGSAFTFSLGTVSFSSLTGPATVTYNYLQASYDSGTKADFSADFFSGGDRIKHQIEITGESGKTSSGSGNAVRVEGATPV